MTEVTRVPLQPIAKGSLTKLWLGIIVAILIGAGIAWAAVPKSVSVETLTEGTGPSPELGQVVFVNYVGKLPDGTVFDESGASQLPPQLFPEGQPLLLEDGALIDGFIEGLQKTQKGGKYVLEIPANKGYGSAPPPGSPIPANSDLIFEVEIVDMMAREDAERRMMAFQQMMQQQQGEGGPGGPGGPAGPPPAAPGN
ncbi:FKBP-type peptidyl-prolyl cis-trans isomerase [Pontixanthobacter aestiaquae]|uniref:Peptidyl-prolyl cis-trans isomerase n=1 Tax=Pontixanthobacter aestiaquae TaxID=1509367 RepID=A0A844Z583_9SPHN|nr:FKBP-type peptidyl-prolyl cis-trans isomerase [Pontixanthobacter aestiaquae]MDN3646100.1 FKBP-type peptidyl-prolyl cis-trans isomerase [Pontixanthobacter aestiaquae]MXO82908.1 peptidylprolyl isomerase [Pontixanthobacter aestiaquae]